MLRGSHITYNVMLIYKYLRVKEKNNKKGKIVILHSLLSPIIKKGNIKKYLMDRVGKST